MKNSFLIALLGIILGLFIAILFGVNEDMFKTKINDGILKNKKYIAIENDVDKKTFMSKESDKNWRYYQRFHFHASAIGAMSLAVLFLLGLTDCKAKNKKILSYILSISGFLYPFVWLLAAIYGPEWGRSEAKETFAIFGYMGGLYLVCMLVVFVMTSKSKELKLDLQ